MYDIPGAQRERKFNDFLQAASAIGLQILMNNALENRILFTCS